MTSKRNNELFHPLEISFCGYSNSGKSTLVARLIDRLSNQLDIGYVKHDAHQFEMDREGKDTWKAKQAGAKVVCITSPEKSAMISENPGDDGWQKFRLADMDVVFIEGYKKSKGKKILVLGEGETAQKTLKEYQDNQFENVVAMVGTSNTAPVEDIPCFHRDDLEQIESYLIGFWNDEIRKRPLYGLVLGGGKSVRMGQDKGALKYFGKSQTEHLWEVLSAHTEHAFVSCRSEQVLSDHISHLPRIEDSYIGFGPTGGILSAMSEYPEASWLVVACDLPYLDSKTIEKLIMRRNPYKIATCYENPEKHWPEPLCTIYEPKAKIKLGQYLSLGKPCPRKVLFNSNIELLQLDRGNALDNVNTPDQYQEVMESIRNGEKI